MFSVVRRVAGKESNFLSGCCQAHVDKIRSIRSMNISTANWSFFSSSASSFCFSWCTWFADTTFWEWVCLSLGNFATSNSCSSITS
jgi:hypothetical protein